MSIDLLLAICVVILALLCVGILLKQDHERRNLPNYKFLYDSLFDSCQEWKTRAQDNAVFRTEAENEVSRLEAAYKKLKGEFFWYEVGEVGGQMAVKLAPESHNVHETNVEDLILRSIDPIWKFIAENRDLMKLWEGKRQDIKDTLPHYRYSHFATWLANFCEGHFNRDDVERAINLMEVTPHA